MGIGERIERVRKEKGLSRRAFGEELGVSLDVINNIERERLKRPEAQEPIYKLICEKFRVNEKWLKTGKGDIFEDIDNTQLFISKLVKGENETAVALFSAFAKFDERDWQAVQKLIDEFKK